MLDSVAVAAAGAHHRLAFRTLAVTDAIAGANDCVVHVVDDGCDLVAPEYAIPLEKGSTVVLTASVVESVRPRGERADVMVLRIDAGQQREGERLLPLVHGRGTDFAAVFAALAAECLSVGKLALRGAELDSPLRQAAAAQQHAFEKLARCRGRTFALRRSQFIRLERARVALCVHDRAPDLTQCARIAHVSVPHFVRIFHEVYGETPTQYRNCRRMAHGLALVAGTDLPLRDIMRRVGFRSLPAFLRAFRQSFGATTTEVRRIHVHERGGLPDLALSGATCSAMGLMSHMPPAGAIRLVPQARAHPEPVLAV